MNRQRKSRDRFVPAAAIALAIATAGPLSAADAPKPEATSCHYNKAEMLALDYQAFDQTPERGWRQFTSGDRCLLEAADLIRDYRVTNKFPHPMLYWHEGQLRALHGSVEEAIPLLDLSRPQEAGITGWNKYVDATIAFLRKDRPALDKARAELAAIPQAPFLGVVDRLGQCFAKSYIESYRKCEQ